MARKANTTKKARKRVRAKLAKDARRHKENEKKGNPGKRFNTTARPLDSSEITRAINFNRQQTNQIISPGHGSNYGYAGGWSWNS